MSEWHPIETAPKDGTWFITYDPECDDKLDLAVFDVEHGHFFKIGCGFHGVTHWMQPAPPKEFER